jgi:hypothetical protein
MLKNISLNSDYSQSKSNLKLQKTEFAPGRRTGKDRSPTSLAVAVDELSNSNVSDVTVLFAGFLTDKVNNLTMN